MVDSINPVNNSQLPDNSEGVIAGPDLNMANNFYAGFNRPEEVHVNLANEGTGAEPTVPNSAPTNPTPQSFAPSPIREPETSQPSSSPSFENFSNPSTRPAVNTHVAYSSDGSESSRSLLIMLGAGFGFVVIVSLATYFIVGAINGNKLSSENKDLESLKTELSSQKEAPIALELPEPTTPPTSTSTPTVENSETEANSGTTSQPTTTTVPVQTPIQIPASTTVSEGGNG